MTNASASYRILPCGDCAVSVDFGSVISPEVNARVHTLRQKISGVNGILETIPTFRALTVIFDPLTLSGKKLGRILRAACEAPGEQENDVSHQKKVFHIPVCYGGEFGADLADVCALTKLSEKELIERHSAPEYLIYMLGFLPGFAYLGGLDPTIAAPRLASPRTEIPAGSVGIGGEQTGIYPLASPGGWRLLGRTPVKPYDVSRKNAILYEAGDFIKFEPITPEEYLILERDVKNGALGCEVTSE